jgi:D-xylonolactonase
MQNSSIRALANEHCKTGENPYWNPDDHCVYWTDIPAGKLFRLDTSTGEHTLIYHDEPVGGFTLQADGEWLLFRVDDIATMSPDGAVQSLLPFIDEGARRFNDVIADPQGRVFAGTIGVTPQTGGLYRVDTNGTITQLFLGTGVANGMAFTTDLQYFYWTCSTSKRIFRFRYDQASGDFSQRELFYEGPPEEGTPDGLVVDTQNNVWSARNNGSCILKHAPDGTVLERITFPIAKLTSLCFGGPVLDTLFVTSGGGEPESTSEDGTLYSVRVDATGQPEYRSRILLDH